MRNDKKYSLIRPCWFEVNVEAFIWIRLVVFGKIVSSQVRSSKDVDSFWLIDRFK